MARTQVRGGGVEVEGLTETVKALNRFDREIGGEAKSLFREAAIDVQAKAKANASSRPGGRYKVAGTRGVKIGRSATQKGAGVKLFARGTGMAAEWGAKWHPTYGHHTLQQRIAGGRTFPVQKGDAFDIDGSGGPGYVVQAAIRSRLPYWEVEVSQRLSMLLTAALDKAGVPRG